MQINTDMQCMYLKFVIKLIAWLMDINTIITVKAKSESSKASRD